MGFRIGVTTIAAGMLLAACGADPSATPDPDLEDLTGTVIGIEQTGAGSVDQSGPPMTGDTRTEGTSRSAAAEPERDSDAEIAASDTGRAASDPGDLVRTDRGAFAVPDEIDEAYVDLVINELLSLQSEATRQALRRQPGSAELAHEIVTEVAGGRRAESERELLDLIVNDPRADEFFLPADTFGVERFEVMELFSVGEDCVTALGWYDLTATTIDPIPPEEFTAWVIARTGPEAGRLNHTGWQLWASVILRDDGEPVPPEEWHTLSGLEESLDVTCGGLA